MDKIRTLQNGSMSFPQLKHDFRVVSLLVLIYNIHMNYIRKTFLLTDVQNDMFMAIKNKNGYKTDSAVFGSALTNLYEKTFKYGADPLQNTLPNDSDEMIHKKALAKAKASKALKEAAENERMAPKIDKCLNLLGGEIEENEGGFKFCRFTTYTLHEDQSQLIPIQQVDPVIADTSLFVPSRESVFKNRPEVRKKFEKLPYYQPKEE